jgi:hypothetical protein
MTPLQYICPKHPTVVQSMIWFNFTKGQGCWFCRNEKLSTVRKGEGNPAWRGGISSIAEYLRKSLEPWKEASMEHCNYRCVISDESFDVIHHIYPFSKIMEETLQETQIPLKQDISEYTQAELDFLTDKCLEVHFRYPLGACLKKQYHRLYHKLHGYEGNIDSFNRFLEKFKKKL